MTKTLHQLFLDHEANCVDKWEQFLPVYEAVFAPYLSRGLPVRLLEIGVQNGGSLEIWSKYLPPDSVIRGVDINPAVGSLTFNHPNVSAHVADATDKLALDALLGDQRFDIIIDDGSHFSSHIIETFGILYDRLLPGGKYIIEDLHCSYYDSHGGGYRSPQSAIEWLKNLVDAVNADHISSHEAVPPRERDIIAAFRSSLASVSFYDSLAIIEKLEAGKTRPYRRMLSGTKAQVLATRDWLSIEPVENLKRILFSERTVKLVDSTLVDLLDETRSKLARLSSEVLDLQSSLELQRKSAKEALDRLEAEHRAALGGVLGAAVRLRVALRTRWRRTTLSHALRRLLPDQATRRMKRDVSICQRAFSRSWYLRQNPDVAAAGVDPIEHYVRSGAAEGRDPSPFFSTSWYLENNPHVSQSRTNPLVHYLQTGASANLDPSPYFSTRWYLERNPDVASAAINPLAHYLEWGVIEGRSPHPLHEQPQDAGVDRETAAKLDALADAALREANEIHAQRQLGESNPPFPRLAQLLARLVSTRTGSYPAWVSARTIKPDDRRYLESRVGEMAHHPVFSVIMPTYRSDLRFLGKAIDSVIGQIYPHWELCLVDDGSDEPELHALLRRYADNEPRIKLHIAPANGGISAASNAALAMATGEFIALVDHDDELAPHALFAMADAINKNPTADMLYSDEDKISTGGRRFGPFFKPDWAPEFMLTCMYTCHLGVYRRSLVEAVGGFRSEFDLAQDYDLALRVSAQARAVVHVPDILYHWRITPQSTAGGASAKPKAELAARRALQAALDAKGVRGRVLETPYRGMHRIQLDLPGKPLVSVVIPTAARRVSPGTERWYLLDLLRSIVGKSTYRRLEIVVVHNGDIEPALARDLAGFAIKYVHYTSPAFNIAEKLNLGVEAATGQYVLLLNDDMTVISPNWIEEMLMWFSMPGVAGVGAKLLFPDDTVQHAGVLLLGQGPSHVYYKARKNFPGLVGTACLVRNYSAVTGACLMTRREDYIDIGGFDPFFRVNYNDIDFCLRLLKRGRIVYTPYSLLYHYESVSKDRAPPKELRDFNMRWSHFVGADPMYNPNLSQSSGFMELAPKTRPIRETY